MILEIKIDLKKLPEISLENFKKIYSKIEEISKLKPFEHSETAKLNFPEMKCNLREIKIEINKKEIKYTVNDKGKKLPEGIYYFLSPIQYFKQDL